MGTAHDENDHMPFARDCATCQKAAGRQEGHQHVPHLDTFTLSIDAAGPVVQGDDVYGAHGNYFLIGAYTLPVTREGEKLNHAAPDACQVLRKAEVDRRDDLPEDDVFAEEEDHAPLPDEKH